MTNDDARFVPAFSHGVRFRRLDDGVGVLLVPEGVVSLNPSAAAVVELVDGTRSAAAIAAVLATRYGEPAATLGADVSDLLRRLSAKMWLRLDA